MCTDSVWGTPGCYGRAQVVMATVPPDFLHTGVKSHVNLHLMNAFVLVLTYCHDLGRTSYWAEQQMFSPTCLQRGRRDRETLMSLEGTIVL